MKPKKQPSKLQVALAMVTDIISPTNFVFFWFGSSLHLLRDRFLKYWGFADLRLENSTRNCVFNHQLMVRFFFSITRAESPF